MLLELAKIDMISPFSNIGDYGRVLKVGKLKDVEAKVA
jgi:hypothetical protein